MTGTHGMDRHACTRAHVTDSGTGTDRGGRTSGGDAAMQALCGLWPLAHK